MVAFEYFDNNAYSVLDLLPFLPSPPFPFSAPGRPFYVLLETASSSEEALDCLLEEFSEACAALVLDSRMSTNEG